MSGSPSIREVAELTARLRALTAAGANADPAERAAFLADKDALLARIAAADADRTAGNPLEQVEEQERHEQLARWHADDQAADGDTDAAGWSR